MMSERAQASIQLGLFRGDGWLVIEKCNVAFDQQIDIRCVPGREYSRA